VIAKAPARGAGVQTMNMHRYEGKRFVVRADENLIAFVELKSAIPDSLVSSTHELLSDIAQARKSTTKVS
jgi:hypothetical protein